jgi:hypothetical protein
MNKYHIRFNKNRGQPGFGTAEHVWRVFENGKQFIVKHVKISVPVWDEVTGDGQGNDNWNFACEGYMAVDKESSTAIISATKPD